MYRNSTSTAAATLGVSTIMVSRIEDALLRSHRAHEPLRETLFQYLDNGLLLRRLRSVSRVFRDLIDSNSYLHARMFHELYIDALLPSPIHVGSLMKVGAVCRYLTIKVGYTHYAFSDDDLALTNTPGVRKPDPLLNTSLNRAMGSTAPTLGSISSASTVRRQNISLRTSASPTRLSPTTSVDRLRLERQWTDILARFEKVEAITLLANGDPGWPGRTEVEDMITILRLAIEKADLKDLRMFSLAPIHAMGVMHLRWLGMGVFRGTHPLGAKVWQNLDTLDLRIQNPFITGRLTEPQETMFKKILYDYLRSFASTLRCLRFIWLGGNGPSPLTMHMLPELESRLEIQWSRLEELWVGNIDLPRQMIKLASKLAPTVTQLMILRSTHRDSSVDAHDSSAWVDMTDLRQGNHYDDTDMASSLYSHNSESEESIWPGGISRTSRELPFFLDL